MDRSAAEFMACTLVAATDSGARVHPPDEVIMQSNVQRHDCLGVQGYTVWPIVLYVPTMDALERAERRLMALSEAQQIAVRLHSLEQEQAALFRQRAETCRGLRDEGVSLKDIQDVFGISRSRVQQLLRLQSEQNT